MADPTVGDLYKTIGDADLRAAVELYLTDPMTGSFPLGNGYSLDLAEAVRAHPPSHRAMRESVSEKHKRDTVRSAFVLARPVKR